MDPESFTPEIGTPVVLSQHLRRIVAPNPSPMTLRGTNTYLLGNREIAVIDPGPDLGAHEAAILGALEPGQRITQIVVTHSHVDHSPLAASLSARTGAPVLAFGDSTAGRSAAMLEAIEAGLTSGGEGIDADFRPDQLLCDGEIFTAGDQQMTAHHTPGHMGNHMCFEWRDAVFCGDLVMGWASSLVSPPDGDLTDFMASCARLQKLAPKTMHSGHGAVIDAPNQRLDWLITHRLGREAQILDALTIGASSAIDLATRIYVDTPAALIPAATRNVFAHLIDLKGKNRVSCQGATREDSLFSLV